MSEMEIGRGKRGSRAWAFDDIAIVPSRRTRDPKDVSTAWKIDAYEFGLPVIGAVIEIWQCDANGIYRHPRDTSWFSKRERDPGFQSRHALSQLIMRGETGSPDLDGVSITVSEVRVSPDLKNATAYVMPLGGEQKQAVLESLLRDSSRRISLTKRAALHFRSRFGLHLVSQEFLNFISGALQR